MVQILPSKANIVTQMIEPKFQLQHRLPKVYLKQFSYREKGRKYISVTRKGSDKTEQVDIEFFTAEENVFDYNVLELLEEKRHFEKLCARIETKYPAILESLKAGKPISEHRWAVLCEFMATLIARSKKQRNFYAELLLSVDSREKLFDEICMFNEDVRFGLDVFAWTYNKEELNRFVAVVAGEHMAKVLTRFSYIILKTSKLRGKKWFTSDCPVCIDNQNQHGYLLPVEAEIYFPLSRDLCLFAYHDNSPVQCHPLRSLEKYQIHECDEISHAYISMHLLHNAYEYSLAPVKLDITFPKRTH